MSLLLWELVKTLAEYPSLYQQVSVEDVGHFLNLTKLVKPYISLTQSVYLAQAPDSLPQYIHNFISAALKIDGEESSCCGWLSASTYGTWNGM